MTFSFLFATPIVADFYNTAASMGFVTVVNPGAGTATVASSNIYPSFLSGYGSLGFVATNLGVDAGTTSCAAGPASTALCPQGPASNTFGLTFYDNLELLLTYTQDTTSSVASWSGAVELGVSRTVPEPVLLSLLGSALIGFAVRRRRA